jgi:RNA polymerase sigma factor (sigma-70 family)
MKTAPIGDVLRLLRLPSGDRDRAAPDADLLGRFPYHRDEAAFAELLRRHGGLVLGVCRRVLGDAHAAEDAFQATFLLLARRAARLGRAGSLAGWLHAVAWRTAQQARRADARRRRREHSHARPEGASPEDLSWREVRQVLDAELTRLPEQYRGPLVLCYLEGLTQAEAARRLGWGQALLRGRLERGRQALRRRLARLGLPLAAPLLLLGGTDPVSASLAAATRTAVRAGLSGGPLAPGVAALVAAGAGRWKLAAGLAVVVLAVGIGVAGAVRPQPAATPPSAAAPPGRAAEVRTDLRGDPLPDEAVSRLGTLRFRHGGAVSFVRFTPDGKTLVTQGADGARTWEVATGKQIHAIPSDTRGAAALSPDGKLLATTGPSGIRVWETASARPLLTLAEDRGFGAVCFSPEGKLLAALTTGWPNRVELLEVASGRLLWSFEERKPPWGYVAFSPEGKAVVVAGWATRQIPPLRDNTVCILDARTGKEQRRIDLGPYTPDGIAVSPDGGLLAVLCDNQGAGQIRVWEVAGGKERFRVEAPVRTDVFEQKHFSAMTFFPKDNTLLTAGGMQRLVAWDLTTGKERRRLGRLMTNSSDLAVSPDGKAVAVAHFGGWVRVIDAASGEDLVAGGGPPFWINSAAFTPDGRHVLTADVHNLILWDPTTGREQARFQKDGNVLGDQWYDLGKDGRTALAINPSKKVLTVCDPLTGKERSRVSLAFVGDNPVVRAMTPGGKVLAVGNWNADTLHLVDATTGKVRRSLREAGKKVAGADFTADGRTVAVFWNADTRHLVDATTIGVWDVATGTRRLQFGRMGPIRGPISVDGWGAVYAAALSPDGKWVAYSTQDGTLAVFEGETGHEVHRLRNLPSGARSFAFSPDGRTLAWGGWSDPMVHLLELASGKERHVLTGHRGAVRLLTFSADGKALVSGSDDTTGLVWDLTGRLSAKGTWDRPPSAPDLDACWTALAGDDAKGAYAAVRKLAAWPDRAVPFLGERLRPVRPADERRLAGLIADLDSNSFAARDNASRELEKLAEAALPAIRKALEGRAGPEARRRLEALAEKPAQAWRTPGPETLRLIRALEALESVGTPEARRVLEGLAQGIPEARLTQEAKAALERLAGRASPDR